MKYFMLTSDRYNFLLEGQYKLFNKHYSDSIDVIALGFDKPTIVLPNNFSFYSMGKQNEHPNWYEPLLSYFEKLKEDYFFVGFEDHYLIKDVDVEKMNEAIQYMENDSSIDKVYLVCDTRAVDRLYKGNFYISKDMPNVLVTTSLLPAIWRKDFFIRMLRGGAKTPHDFEIMYNKLTLGCKTILTYDVPIYPILDAVRKGGYNNNIFNMWNNNRACTKLPWQTWLYNIEKEDMDIFYEMQIKWSKKNGNL